MIDFCDPQNAGFINEFIAAVQIGCMLDSGWSLRDWCEFRLTGIDPKPNGEN